MRKNYVCYFRFQGQPLPVGNMPCDFRLAIEEAFLAEHGFLRLPEDMNAGDGTVLNRSIPRGVQEATGSSHVHESQSQMKVRWPLFPVFPYYLMGSRGLSLGLWAHVQTMF